MSSLGRRPDEEEDEEEDNDDKENDDDDRHDRRGLLGVRVEHVSISHRETAVEENQIGRTSTSLDRRE
jgi:hypothetical protein